MNAASASTSTISSITTHMLRRLLLCAAAGAICGCAPVERVPENPPPAAYVASGFGSLPGWAESPPEARRGSLRAFLKGCAQRALPAALVTLCFEARQLDEHDSEAIRAYFERSFVPYRLLAEGRDSGLITGYYEPVIAGSRERDLRHPHPVYGVPSDLVVVDLAGLYPELRDLRLRGRLEGRRLIPYYSRAEIEARADRMSAPVIAWAADAVELFFLQIQGSGQLQFADGTRIRIGYAEQNGHPYRALGRHLVDRGELTLEQATMDGIKDWAARNPARLKEALATNGSYVFFRELPAADGPIGSLGAPLSAGYSIAVDRRYIPLGAPVWLRTADPLDGTPIARLMMAQDTGGAIRGAVRADLFWGLGPAAGERAGRMRQQGSLWLLWPRGAPPPAP